MRKVPASAPAPRSAGRGLILQYSLLFALMAALVFFWFAVTGKTFVWMYDGIKQHYRAMVWYGAAMRSALRDLLQGKGFTFPSFSFSLGEGNDVFSSLHYYVIGDPLSLGAMFVPGRLMYHYYGFAQLLRLYLAGLAFLYLGRQVGLKDRMGLLAGSLLYVFSYWTLRNINRHPFFLNPLIYLPLILAGAERVLRGKKPCVLILSVCLAAVSNFYFLYMHAVLTALYVLLRLIQIFRRDRRTALRRLLVLLGSALLGAAMAAAVLVPILYAFFHDVRAGGSHAQHLLYPLVYYSRLPYILLGTESRYWLCVGLGAPALTGLTLLYCRRSHRLLQLLMGLGLIMLLFPFFGRALNGFAYIANRWSWAFVLAASCSFAAVWPEMTTMTKREWWISAGVLLGYILLCLLGAWGRFHTIAASLGTGLVFLLVLLPGKSPADPARQRRQARLALAVTALSVLVNGTAKFAPFFKDGTSGSLTVQEVTDRMYANETLPIRKAAAAEGFSDFYRYSGLDLTENAGLEAGLSTTQYYFSLSNPAVARYRDGLALTDSGTSYSMSYDDRVIPMAMACVRYYALAREGAGQVPYGFVPTGFSNEAQKIYRSCYALPMGWVYDSWIDEAAYQAASYAARPELSLRAAVLTDDPGSLPRYTGQVETRRVEAQALQVDPDAIPGENRITVTRADAEVCFLLTGALPGETLCEIHGLQLEAATRYDLYFGDEELDPEDRCSRAQWDALDSKTQRIIRQEHRLAMPTDIADLCFRTDGGGEALLHFFTPEYNFYNGRHDFCINLRQNDVPVREVRIRFSVPGIYRYDSLEFYVQPLSELRTLTAARTEATPAIQFTEDGLTGEITLDQTRLLCLSVPYSEGWTATVDGVPAALLQVNLKNVGLLLEPGTHRFVLRYTRPLGRLGLGISLCGWGCFGLLLALCGCLQSRRKRAIMKKEQKP